MTGHGRLGGRLKLGLVPIGGVALLRHQGAGVGVDLLSRIGAVQRLAFLALQRRQHGLLIAAQGVGRRGQSRRRGGSEKRIPGLGVMIDHLLGEGANLLVVALGEHQPAGQDFVLVGLRRRREEGFTAQRALSRPHATGDEGHGESERDETDIGHGASPGPQGCPSPPPAPKMLPVV